MWDPLYGVKTVLVAHIPARLNRDAALETTSRVEVTCICLSTALGS